MKILLTNDDGINSEGLKKLEALLRSGGKYKVSVVAPESDRSGVSQSINILKNPVKIKNLGNDTWSCSGTPADCVIAAIRGRFCEKPDLILSGINHGANLGTDLIFSGTAAGARQASLYDIPGIALSLSTRGPYFWDMAVSWIVEHLDELLSYWRKYTFVNVNIPNREEGPLGIIPTWPGLKRYKDFLTEEQAEGGVLLCTLKGMGESDDIEAGSDVDVISRNYVSVSTLNSLPVVVRNVCPEAPDYAAVAPRI